MSDKMREAFEKWAIDNGHSIGKYVNEFHQGEYLSEYTAFAWMAWQAAQSAAVPVVGDALYWIDPDDDANIVRTRRVGWSPLYGQPATSITAAELERLQRNDARYMWMRNHTSFNYSVHKAAEVGGIELDQVIDAAIAGEKK